VDHLYILGGGTSMSVFGFKNIQTFNTVDNEWRSLRTEPDKDTTIDRSDGMGYPDARRCHGALQINHMVYIVGGYDGDEIFNDIWRLDLHTLNWVRLNIDLPTPVYFQATTLSEDGQLFMFGGVDSIEENTRTDKIYSVWLQPPSLRSICWESIQYYIPNISSIKPGHLRELGIPENYLRRVVSGRAVFG
jgi:hypothetical protein